MTTGMSLCVLGSGSTGNCSVLVCESSNGERTVSLIDLGLSPRETARRLHRVGLRLEEVDSALITHFDSDHFYQGWINAGRKLGLTLRFHRHHRSFAHRAGATVVRCECFHTAFDLCDGVHVQPVHFAHDEHGTVGYRFDSLAGSIGFATDLGSVPGDLYKHFTGLDVLALESNYCPVMQRESDRPIFLKKRIMGGSGHLSNEQSFEAVQRIAATSRLQTICLLHLSQQCNDPKRIEAIYEAAPQLRDKLVLSHHDRPTPWMRLKTTPAQRPDRCLFTNASFASAK